MTTSRTRHETAIEVGTDLPTVRIVREFDAPVAAVLRAHTDPHLAVRWLGPHRLTMRVDHWDGRTGGAYRYVHTDADGTEYAFHGSFHEVRDDGLVQTFTWEGEPDQGLLERLVLTDLGDGRCRLTATSHHESFAARDGMVASGMETGVREGYERLDALLAD